MELADWGYIFTGGLVVFAAAAMYYVLFNPYNHGFDNGYSVGYRAAEWDMEPRTNSHNADSADVDPDPVRIPTLGNTILTTPTGLYGTEKNSSEISSDFAVGEED